VAVAAAVVGSGPCFDGAMLFLGPCSVVISFNAGIVTEL
jgi:hypothetical protein